MEPDVQKFLIEALSDKELTEVVSDLFLDDTVDLIEEMPANVVKRILDNTSPETITLINQLSIHFIRFIFKILINIFIIKRFINFIYIANRKFFLIEKLIFKFFYKSSVILI